MKAIVACMTQCKIGYEVDDDDDGVVFDFRDFCSHLVILMSDVDDNTHDDDDDDAFLFSISLYFL